MLDILSLLQCLLPQINTTTMRQLNRAILAMLAMSGRVTMRGISRWAGVGGSYRKRKVSVDDQKGAKIRNISLMNILNPVNALVVNTVTRLTIVTCLTNIYLKVPEMIKSKRMFIKPLYSTRNLPKH